MSLYRDYLESAFVVGNGVNKPLLGGQAAAALAPRVVYTQVDSFPDPGDPSQTCYRFYFEGAALSPAEEATFDAVVAAHDGSTKIAVGADVIAVANITEAVTVDSTTWRRIGGVVTEPYFFHKDLTEIAARCTGLAENIVGTLQLRLCEHLGGDPAQAKELTPIYEHTDQDPPVFLFDTDDDPSEGLNSYEVEARMKNAAESADVSMVSTTMLKMLYSGG